MRVSMKLKWKNASILDRIVSVISIAASISVLVLAILQIFEVWDEAVNIFVPLLGVVELCQAYMYRKTDRKIAYFSLGIAIFIFICAVIIFFK